MEWRIKLTVPTFYVDPDSSADTISYVPMFDQDYAINISFPKSKAKLSYSGQMTVPYMVAYDLSPIYEYSYNWTGLTEAQKDTFLSFIESFNNSFQKFNLEVQQDSSPEWNMDVVINSNSITIEKNRLDLYSVSLTLVQL